MESHAAPGSPALLTDEAPASPGSRTVTWPGSCVGRSQTDREWNRCNPGDVVTCFKKQEESGRGGLESPRHMNKLQGELQ